MRNYIHINLCINLMLAQLVFVVGVDKTENKVPMSAICTLMVAPSCSPAPSIHTHTHTHTHTPFSSSLSLGWLLSSGSSAPLSLHFPCSLCVRCFMRYVSTESHLSTHAGSGYLHYFCPTIQTSKRMGSITNDVITSDASLWLHCGYKLQHPGLRMHAIIDSYIIMMQYKPF